MKIRLTGLQEVQLPALVEIDGLCSELYYAAGFDAAEVPVRSQADFASLARSNSCRVAEIDSAPVGFLAWHDEAPGVALLVDVQVHPEHQRSGVATKLLAWMREDARGYGFEHIVTRCWANAPWAMAFYRHQQFLPIDIAGASPPKRVVEWQDQRLATGKPLTRPGEVTLWSPVGTGAASAGPGHTTPADDTLVTGRSKLS